MKPRIAVFIPPALILSACATPVPPAPTQDTNAIVQTAIAATTTFQAAVDAAAGATATYQANVDQAVQATVAAMPLPATPTPAPAPDATSMTEEELAALIDTAVDEAVAASEASYAYTTDATTDGTVTAEEAYAALEAVYAAEAALEYTDELIGEYYSLYGEYADESLASLQAIEQDLDAIATSLEQTTAILEQGAESASQAADQLNQAASAAQAQAGEVQAASQAWTTQLQSILQVREGQALNLPATEVAPDRNAAIEQLYTYIETIKSALGDGRVSPGELNQIAQLAANVKASLGQHGGPALQGLAGGIDGLTRQLARGEWNRARDGLGGFEASLPPRPRK